MKTISIITIILACVFSSCSNKECKPIQVNKGDTIVFRYPNIPDAMMYDNAKFTIYQPHTDSVVITYNYKCK